MRLGKDEIINKFYQISRGNLTADVVTNTIEGPGLKDVMLRKVT